MDVMVTPQQSTRDRVGPAFEDFYGVRKDAVFRAVLVAVGDRAAAEDAVAEAFARAYARWSSVAEHPKSHRLGAPDRPQRSAFVVAQITSGGCAPATKPAETRPAETKEVR